MLCCTPFQHPHPPTPAALTNVVGGTDLHARRMETVWRRWAGEYAARQFKVQILDEPILSKPLKVVVGAEEQASGLPSFKHGTIPGDPSGKWRMDRARWKGMPRGRQEKRHMRHGNTPCVPHLLGRHTMAPGAMLRASHANQTIRRALTKSRKRSPGLKNTPKPKSVSFSSPSGPCEVARARAAASVSSSPCNALYARSARVQDTP